MSAEGIVREPTAEEYFDDAVQEYFSAGNTEALGDLHTHIENDIKRYEGDKVSGRNWTRGDDSDLVDLYVQRGKVIRIMKKIKPL